jgi:hypothetical protein
MQKTSISANLIRLISCALRPLTRLGPDVPRGDVKITDAFEREMELRSFSATRLFH